MGAAASIVEVQSKAWCDVGECAEELNLPRDDEALRFVFDYCKDEDGAVSVEDVQRHECASAARPVK